MAYKHEYYPASISGGKPEIKAYSFHHNGYYYVTVYCLKPNGTTGEIMRRMFSGEPLYVIPIVNGFVVVGERLSGEGCNLPLFSNLAVILATGRCFGVSLINYHEHVLTEADAGIAYRKSIHLYETETKIHYVILVDHHTGLGKITIVRKNPY